MKVARSTMFLATALLALCSNLSVAQEAVDLITLKKPIDGFKRSGGVNLYGGAMYSNASSVSTTRVDMAEADDGVLIRVDLNLYKFTSDHKQLWQVELPKEFGIMDMPYMEMFSDKSSTYTVEIKTNPPTADKISVVQVLPDGTTFAQKYKVDIFRNDGFQFYVLNGDLFCLGKKQNTKTGKIEYRLYQIDKSERKLTIKDLELPTSDEEYKLRKKGEDVFWYVIGKQDGKMLLEKSHFKDSGVKKAKTMVMQLCELDAKGNVSSSKELSFEPSLAGLDRKFGPPAVSYNEVDNSLTVAGFMEIDNKRINGLYLLKYDYQTGAIVYKHEHAFKDILKPGIKPKYKVHYEIPENVNNVYPLQLRSADIQTDQQTRFTDIRIITDFDMNSSTFFHVKFDQYGHHVQTGLAEFRQLINGFGEIIPKANGYQLLWRDETRPHVKDATPGLWDMIDAKASQDKKDDFYWLPITKTSGNSLLCFSQSEGIFKVISTRRK